MRHLFDLMARFSASRMLLAGPGAGPAGAQAMGDGHLGMDPWVMGNGRSRTIETLAQWLARAGFHAAGRIRNALPLQTLGWITHPIVATSIRGA